MKSDQINLKISVSKDIIFTEASTVNNNIGLLELSVRSRNRIYIKKFRIINSVSHNLKGLGRTMLYESLKKGISTSMFTRGSVVYTTNYDLWMILEKVKFEKKDGILQQSVGIVIDALEAQIDSLENGFAPVGAGTYGCVFIPHLPSEGVSADAPRDPRLVSKLMTIRAATDEFNEQSDVKQRLLESRILNPSYEEEQYLFSIGGVQKVGGVTQSDLIGYEGTCVNFSKYDNEYNKSMLLDPETSSGFRKLDALNGGRDLDHWRRILTPTILKDMVIAFVDLLDAIVKMNNVGVNHCDLKAGNLVWKGGKNKIGIIDWGLAHTEDTFDDENWGVDADFPMSSWMWNAPLISVIFKESFQRDMERLNIYRYKHDEQKILEILNKSLIFDFLEEKKNPSYPDTHIGNLKNDLKNILDRNSTTITRNPMFGVNKDGFTEKEQIILTLMSTQVMSVYKNHPGAIGENGLKFWENVYKHNSDIWGAMTTFGAIGKKLVDGGGKYGDTTLLSKILLKVFVSNEWQSDKIDVDSLKTDLLAFADTIPTLDDKLLVDKVQTLKKEMIITPEFIKNESFRRSNYMSNQPHLTQQTRAIMIDWLGRVHRSMNMFSETLYQSVILFDGYVASTSEIIPLEKIQMIGIVALKISSENNDYVVLTNKKIERICSGGCPIETSIDIEKQMIKYKSKTNYVTSAHELLLKYLSVSDVTFIVSQLAMYALESTLQSYELLEYAPSKIAAASLYLAKRTDGKDLWNDDEMSFTGYIESDIKPIADIIIDGFRNPDIDMESLKKKYKLIGNGGFKSNVFG
jgi:serine/threonine protein kinase